MARGVLRSATPLTGKAQVDGEVFTHGRITRRTGAVTEAATVGSISLRRRRCRSAACTADLDSPVFDAIVCKLAETVSRLDFAACRSWIELRIAHSATRVVLFTPQGHEDRIGTFFNGSFACDDVAATYRQLKGRGVHFVSEPQKQPWGEFAVFEDPDGNQFVLSST